MPTKSSQHCGDLNSENRPVEKKIESGRHSRRHRGRDRSQVFQKRWMSRLPRVTTTVRVGDLLGLAPRSEVGDSGSIGTKKVSFKALRTTGGFTPHRNHVSTSEQPTASLTSQRVLAWKRQALSNEACCCGVLRSSRSTPHHIVGAVDPARSTQFERRPHRTTCGPSTSSSAM